ncbi:hypothetical protein GCM10023149_01680 [Mucilaginibacter gynuensis]|uniref:MFS transporter n=2 Tax=Mucilaginibacter gynuensis TaxID=1302236 RepID=A0ABP8FNV7_9SPHI
MLLWLSYLFINNKNQQALHQQQPIVKTTSGLHIIWAGRGIYTFVYLSGVFHSGVFVWIIYYFSTQYQLDEFQIAPPLLIFGFPGLTITMLMFRYHLDGKVIKILYSGFILTIAGLFVMTANLPLWMAEWLLAIMSVGYCFSQPLFIGILKLPLAGVYAGRLIAIGSGILFAGYGTGPLLMTMLLATNKAVPIVFLVLLILIMATLSRRIWNIPELHKRHYMLLRKWQRSKIY